MTRRKRHDRTTILVQCRVLLDRRRSPHRWVLPALLEEPAPVVGVVVGLAHVGREQEEVAEEAQAAHAPARGEEHEGVAAPLQVPVVQPEPAAHHVPKAAVCYMGRDPATCNQVPS